MPYMNDKQRVEYAFNMKRFMSDIRLKTGLTTLNDLENILPANKSMLSRWENGINMPTLDNFMEICAHLQLEPGNYFDKQIWELKEGDDGE